MSNIAEIRSLVATGDYAAACPLVSTVAEADYLGSFLRHNGRVRVPCAQVTECQVWTPGPDYESAVSFYGEIIRARVSYAPYAHEITTRVLGGAEYTVRVTVLPAFSGVEQFRLYAWKGGSYARFDCPDGSAYIYHCHLTEVRPVSWRPCGK